MKRLLYVILMLLVSVTLWAGNSEEEEDWLKLEDSASYWERVDESVSALGDEESFGLVSFLDFRDAAMAFNESVSVLDDRGQYNPKTFFLVCENMFKIASKYSTLREKHPQAARIAGALLAATEIGTKDIVFGFATDAFEEGIESEWGAQNKEKARMLKRVAKQIRADFESFK